MELQYVEDYSTSPTRQSLLQYSVNPDKVYVSTDDKTLYADLTLTVFNPHPAPVVCQALQFGYLSGAAHGNLTDNMGTIESSSDQTAWGISQTASVDPDSPNKYNFTATPAGAGVQSLSLAPNESLYFHLDSVEIDETVGEGVAPIFITEMTGADPLNPWVVHGQLAINKESGQLSIASFVLTEAGPYDPDAPVTLSWTLLGSDRWQLYDDAMVVYDSEKSTPPDAHSFTVYPKRDTTYLLRAYAGGLFVTRTADVMVRAARFVTQPTAQPPEVAYDKTSMLSWQTHYAAKLVITAPGFQPVTLTAPKGQYDLFLAAPDNKLPVPPNTYTLTAYGPGNSQETAQVIILLAYPPPTVNTFTVTPRAPVPSGESVHLAWGTSYATIALLSRTVLGSNTPATSQIVATNSSEYAGSVYPVRADGISYYTLLLRGQGQQQAASAPVMVIENCGAHFLGLIPTQAVYDDDAHVWVIGPYGMCVLNNDGNPAAMYVDDRSLSGIASGGKNVWVSSSGSGGNGKGFIAAVQIVNFNAKFVRTYPLDLSASSSFDFLPSLPLAYDSLHQCLWVAGQSAPGVYHACKLRVSDGKVLGSFPVGRNPNRVLFDGARVWVSSPDDSSVTVLNAADGSLVEHPAFANNPVTFAGKPQAMAFDGTHVWIGLDNDTVVVLRADDGRQVCPPTDVGGKPTDLCYDGFNVWVGQISGPVNGQTGNVIVLRLNDDAVEVAMPLFPVGLAFVCMAFDGKYMWVAPPGGQILQF